MKVNQNLSAVIANVHLHDAEDKLAASIERLSSGFKINKAKDSPSGMAISNKMRAQIEALSQSSRNAADGVSVIQTADGALNETIAILQRMRELSVQGATDSMTPSDKKALQDEVMELQKEVDRISEDTEFNCKSLLNGSQDRKIYSDVVGIENFACSEQVEAGDYKFEITGATRAQLDVPGLSLIPVAAGTTRSFDICGQSFSITAPETEEIPSNGVVAAIRENAEMLGIDLIESGGAFYLRNEKYGESPEIALTVDGTLYGPVKGKDSQVRLIETGGSEAGFTATSTVDVKGNRVTITDSNGFEISFTDVSEAAAGTEVTLDVTDMGTMKLQIGAHEDQIIEVAIPSADCVSLGIDKLNLVRSGGASEAIATLDDAIAKVSSIRSRMGAYQNRLDYAVKSLAGTEENMEAAISRVMDTDMAEEMATYSNSNVLNQAAISVLTQANDMPQQVLQLLQ